MTGFQHTEVVHMYGNKKFSLVKADMSISDRGDLVVNLKSKKVNIEKAPVVLTLTPADARRIGKELMEIGARGSELHTTAHQMAKNTSKIAGSSHEASVSQNASC